jgi:response regulator RpfG family c-di-GMP phosphodiesterase
MKNRLVACFNSSDDLLEIMRDALQEDGYQVMTAHVHDIERGRVDLRKLLVEHDPPVLVWDLSPPYDRTHQFLEMMRHLDEMKGRCVIVTTTNKRAVEEIAHVSDTLELVGRPFDLEELTRRVAAAFARCAPQDAVVDPGETSSLPNG